MAIVERLTSCYDWTSLEEQLQTKQNSEIAYIDKITKRPYFLFVTYTDTKEYLIEIPDYNISKTFSTKYDVYVELAWFLKSHSRLADNSISTETIELVDFEDNLFDYETEELEQYTGYEKRLYLKEKLKNENKFVTNDFFSKFRRFKMYMSWKVLLEDQELNPITKVFYRYGSWVYKEDEIQVHRNVVIMFHVLERDWKGLYTKLLSWKSLSTVEWENIIELVEPEVFDYREENWKFVNYTPKRIVDKTWDQFNVVLANKKKLSYAQQRISKWISTLNVSNDFDDIDNYIIESTNNTVDNDFDFDNDF